MLKDKKSILIAFVILSGLYFIYVISSGSSKMIGDEVGGDPGGMILPLVFSIFMFIASVYLLITDKRSEKKKTRCRSLKSACLSLRSRLLLLIYFAYGVRALFRVRYSFCFVCVLQINREISVRKI